MQKAMHDIIFTASQVTRDEGTNNSIEWLNGSVVTLTKYVWWTGRKHNHSKWTEQKTEGDGLELRHRLISRNSAIKMNKERSR